MLIRCKLNKIIAKIKKRLTFFPTIKLHKTKIYKIYYLYKNEYNMYIHKTNLNLIFF